MTYVFSPCLAGLDPASHPVKSRRDVPLARLYRQDSMGLRVKPARTRAHFDAPPLFFLRVRL